MEFSIEFNGRETTVSIEKGILCYPERNQLEIDYRNQVIRGFRYEKGIFLRPDSFRLVTEYDYTIVLERVPDLSADYEEFHNYKNLRSWLHRNDAELLLQNVKIFIYGIVLKLYIYVPQNATVSIVHSKQILNFDKYYEIEPEEDND